MAQAARHQVSAATGQMSAALPAPLSVRPGSILQVGVFFDSYRCQLLVKDGLPVNTVQFTRTERAAAGRVMNGRSANADVECSHLVGLKRGDLSVNGLNHEYA